MNSLASVQTKAPAIVQRQCGRDVTETAQHQLKGLRGRAR